MAALLVIALICDQCGIEAGRHFRCLADVDAWMRASGWRELSYCDWCPDCLSRPDNTPGDQPA